MNVCVFRMLDEENDNRKHTGFINFELQNNKLILLLRQTVRHLSKFFKLKTVIIILSNCLC